VRTRWEDKTGDVWSFLGFARQVGDMPFDEEHLADMRERQVIRGGQDLDGAGGDPAVALIGGGAGDRHLAPRQRIEYAGQGLPVLLHREHELAAMLKAAMAGRLIYHGTKPSSFGVRRAPAEQERGLLGTRLKDPSARDLRHCLSPCPGLDTAGKNVSWLIEADA
jgi:hypothetical protein